MELQRFKNISSVKPKISFIKFTIRLTAGIKCIFIIILTVNIKTLGILKTLQ